MESQSEISHSCQVPFPKVINQIGQPSSGWGIEGESQDVGKEARNNILMESLSQKTRSQEKGHPLLTFQDF